MNKRICPEHLRGLSPGRSYHDLTPEQIDRLRKFMGLPQPKGEPFNFETKTRSGNGFVKGGIAEHALGDVPSEQVRSYDETEGVAALFRKHFGFDRLEKIAKQSNPILEGLRFKSVNAPSLRYVPETGLPLGDGELRLDGKHIGRITSMTIHPAPSGSMTGRVDHTKPNPSAEPKRANEDIQIVYQPNGQPPKSSQPQRDARALAVALMTGRSKLDAELIAECACQPGATVSELLDLPSKQLFERACGWRDLKAKFEKQNAEQPAPEGEAYSISANSVLRAMNHGRTMEDSKYIGEIYAGQTDHNLSNLLTMSSNELKRLVTSIRANRQKIRDDRRAEPRDTCSATPPGQPEPKIKISVYINDGNVFEYEVRDVTAARDHVSKIVATGYRHSAANATDELVHYPPHRIDKVKMKGPGISTNYYDSPRGT